LKSTGPCVCRSDVGFRIPLTAVQASRDSGRIAPLDQDRWTKEVSQATCAYPETKSDNTDDEVRRGSAGQRAGQAVGSADGLANPCPETGAFGIRCNSRCRPQRSGANGPRRRQPYDQGTPCGSSRSVFPHTRSAKVTAGPLGDLGYPSPLDASCPPDRRTRRDL
jgi:hypothetical protein